MSVKLELANQAIVAALTDLEGHFNPTAKLTFVMRDPSVSKDAYLIQSSDDLREVAFLLQRSGTPGDESGDA